MAKYQNDNKLRDTSYMGRNPKTPDPANPPRGAFGYYGSKQRLAKGILKYMPPHHCWVELFGGLSRVDDGKKTGNDRDHKRSR